MNDHARTDSSDPFVGNPSHDGDDPTIDTIMVEAGRLVFQEGDPGDYMYVIEDGAVELYRSRGNERAVIAKLGWGDPFGEMALVDGRARMATARTVTPTRLTRIPGAIFRAHLNQSPTFLRAVVQMLVQHLRGVRYTHAVSELVPTHAVEDLGNPAHRH